MKALRFYKHVFLWAGVVLAGVLLPRLALAGDCESELKAIFQKKSVEMEMAVIVGEVTELEATGNREKLQKKLKREKDTCNRRLAASRAEAESGSL